MPYRQIAQLELMNALNNINSEEDLKEFKNLIAQFFAQKAQAAIDELWDKGVINEDTIEQWGNEHMRTPYRQWIAWLKRTNQEYIKKQQLDKE